ncbi:hypothetical protein PoB_007582800 [Plakobranchus ocellatus]|uniref:Uncharacterized protein n=1 Tax=Plakobranchus ocellatus TaxID=259542 RepID=A0AAV4DYG5_9GAST|nr:hypothetical protein PoB_007582800 [Plakobranchus ocellatus]
MRNKASPLVFKFDAPAPPKLKINFVNTGQLVLGGDLDAQCSAFIGTNGTMTFVIAKQGKTATDLSNVTVYKFKQNDPVQVLGFQRPYINTSNKTDYSNRLQGPRFTATLSAKVTKTLNGTVFICYSVDKSASAAFASPEANRKASEKVEVKYRGTDPLLSVTYVPYSPYITDGKVLQTMCAAFVGSKGTLTWILQYMDKTSNNWIVTLNGKLYGIIDGTVNITFKVTNGGVDGTVASESGSAGTLLSLVYAPPPLPWPYGEPET